MGKIILLFLLPFTLSAQVRKDSVSKYVPFIQPSKTLPLLKVVMNKKETYMLLDTGAAGACLLDYGQKNEYNYTLLPVDNIQVRGLGTIKSVYHVVGIDSIKIYKTSYLIECYSADIKGVVDNIQRTTNIKIVGIIGSEFFEEQGVIIDYRRNALIFPQQGSVRKTIRR